MCANILRCFASSARFAECRERIAELPSVVKEMCRCLWLQGASALTAAAIECVCSFSVDSILQNQLLQVGMGCVSAVCFAVAVAVAL